jgi:hypothetical protein
MDTKKLIKYQPFYFTNLVFVATLLLGGQIKPLNLLVFVGSIILVHIYPKVFTDLSKVIPCNLLMLYDMFIHWFPMYYAFVIHKNDKIRWDYVFLLIIIYIIYAYKYIDDVYFNIKKTFSIKID